MNFESVFSLPGQEAEIREKSAVKSKINEGMKPRNLRSVTEWFGAAYEYFETKDGKIL